MSLIIKRNFYLDRLIRSMWNGEVKVITGLHRCGKSVLLFELFYDYLIAGGVKEDEIITLALDRRKFFKFRNPVTLCEYVESIVNARKDRKFYLFVDEVQMTAKVKDKDNGGVEVSIYDMLNELKSYKNLDVYVTGSNSEMLSSDIATEFRGRATQIHVFPLSFEEFYSFAGGETRAALERYMLYGGMPRITAFSDDRERKAYLSDLFEELYVKDVVERNGLEREDILNAILDFLASQVASLTNPTSIANALSSALREKVYSETVSSYIKHIENAFLIKEAKRYDVKGKAYFSYPNKYYFTDVGLRAARLNFRQYDPGHIMENVIFNDLVRRGYSVDVGAVTDRSGGGKSAREIDFVVNDADRRVYIQSAFRMDDEGKSDSELRPLLLTGDFFRKVIVRMDIPHSFYDDNGIFHCNLVDFLLGREVLF